MVRDHGRAEDITQDVFISALRRIRVSDAEIAFKPWIYEIAKNACIDAFRRSRRAEEISYDADDGAERIGGVDTAPDAALDARLKLDNLRGAFDGLSDAHHQVLVMRELGGLSYREIGERMGMTRPAVESTLFRARRRLAEEYDELVSGRRCLRVRAIIAEACAGSGVGVRDERRMARHVSHCQPCRREAAAAGFDVATLAQRSVRAKVAALLPVPAFLKRWVAGGDGGALAGGHGGAAAQWSSSLGRYAEPTWAKAAALVATVAVAGLGAGVATRDGGSSHRSPAVAPVVGVPPAKAVQGSPGVGSASGSAGARGGSSARSGHGSGGGSAGASSSRSSGAGAGGPSSSSSSHAAPASPSTPSATGTEAKQAPSGADDAGGQTRRAPVSKPTPTTSSGAGASTPAAPSAPDAGQVVGGVTKTVNGTAGAVTNAVNGTVDGATGAVDHTTQAVTGTVDQATGGAVQGATGAVQGTLDATTRAARDTTHNATGAVDQTARDMTGLLGGGGGS
jgi:RNA polymerase sigma factor (sigma-70 family)